MKKFEKLLNNKVMFLKTFQFLFEYRRDEGKRIEEEVLNKLKKISKRKIKKEEKLKKMSLLINEELIDS